MKTYGEYENSRVLLENPAFAGFFALKKGEQVMRFRPCIDIHNGKVKQIVGSSLKDQGDQAAENFVAEKDAAWYA